MPDISISITGNGGTTAVVQPSVSTLVTLAGGGGGGTSYDQSLNTTDSVDFNSVATNSVIFPTSTGTAALSGNSNGDRLEFNGNEFFPGPNYWQGVPGSESYAMENVGGLDVYLHGLVYTTDNFYPYAIYGNSFSNDQYGNTYLSDGSGNTYLNGYTISTDGTSFYVNGTAVGGGGSWQEVYGGTGIEPVYDAVYLSNHYYQTTYLNGYSISTDGTSLYINGTAIGGGGSSYDQSLNTTDVVKFTGLVVGTELGSYVHSGSHRSQIVATGTQTPLMIEGGSGAIEIWKDTSPSAAVSFGLAVPGTSSTSDFIFGRYASGWAERFRVVSGGGVKITPTSAPSSPTAGQIYYDSSTNHFFGYNGSTWKQLDN